MLINEQGIKASTNVIHFDIHDDVWLFEILI